MDFQAYFDLQLGSGSFWLGYCAALLAEDSGQLGVESWGEPHDLNWTVGELGFWFPCKNEIVFYFSFDFGEKRLVLEKKFF